MQTRIALYLALLMAGLVTAITIRNASFTPWGTDPGSYVNAARRWADGDLFAPDALQLWPQKYQVGVPLGNTPGVIQGTHVSIYPLGFPVLAAVADLVDRDLGVYVVAPFFAGVLVLTTFLIATHVTSPAGALLAASVVALSPIVIIHAVTPMSDVPATALLMLAIVMSLRTSAVAAIAGGLALGMAVMTRPILAPLGVVPFVLILRRNWKHAALFAVTAATGPALLAWSQLVFYGGALKSGYPGFEGFFSRDRIGVNAQVYVRNLATLHSPFIFLGLAAVIPLYFTRDERSRQSLSVIAALVAIVVINYVLYLPYMTYDDVWSTRFVLPAQIALFILLGTAVSDAVVAVSRVSRVLSLVCVMPLLIVAYEGTRLFPIVFAAWPGQSHVRLMGYYLRDALPRNAAVISFLHSNGIAYHTGAQIVRFDMLSATDAEAFIDTLVRRGYEPVVVIDAVNEVGTYAMTLGATKFTLDWPERATSMGFTAMRYLPLRDRGVPRNLLPHSEVLRDQK